MLHNIHFLTKVIPRPLKITVDTTQSGSSSDTFVLPLQSGITNCLVSWGDGSENLITAYNQPELTHIYSSGGTYQIEISGEIQGFFFNNVGDKLKLSSIDQFGNVLLSKMTGAFFGCSNMIANYSDSPTINAGCSWNSSFRSCTLFNGKVNDWDWSKFYRSDFMFTSSGFNQSISGIDMSGLTFLNGTFTYAESFSQDIGNLLFTSTNRISNLFDHCDVNSPLTNWDTAHITKFQALFDGNTNFDQDLSGLNISSLTTASLMLRGATLSTVNYDALLIGWEAQPHQSNVPFHAGNSTYTIGSAADTARSALIANGWVISDGGGV